MSTAVRLAEWFAGGAARLLVIAEVAQAHDGSLGTAHAFIDAIAAAGADAVKFQTHIAAAESTPTEAWRQPFSLQDASRYDYWRRMEFSPEQWRGLKRHAEERGLIFLSSPFSEAAVDLLQEIGIEGWKVASGEVGHGQLLTALRATGKPVILSSGMSSWNELDAAVETLRGGAVAVLQCTSRYPCPPEAVGLNLLADLRRRYDCPVGLSDHSGTIYPGLAAVTLGASLLEVHITLSRRAFGPDVPASLTPRQLRRLVEGARCVRRMLDHPVDKNDMAVELAPLRALFTRSVVAARDLPAGRVLERGDLAIKKPGTGLPPERLETLVGRRLAVDLEADQLIAPQHLEGEAGSPAAGGTGGAGDE